MVKELFSADANSKKVKALGVETTANLEDIKILINEVNIAENLNLNSVRIIIEKSE